ncbi:MAG: hemerythrin domain-containing protein [Nitrospirales bacterium]
MAQLKPIETSLPVDIRRVVKEDHERILALFRLYLGSPPDSRQTIVEDILHRLTSQLEREERLFQEIRKSGPQNRKLVVDAEVEHENIKAMILELQQSETDDDQDLDEFFEDMMQSVRTLFVIEERDLLPIFDRSLDS